MSTDFGILFPDPSVIEGDLVGVGGDLSPPTLLAAYRRGIFPWFSDNDPIIWWSLNPRFVVFPQRLHISSSLRKRIRGKTFRITLDQAFEDVIEGCRTSPRAGQEGTWITSEMMDAYIQLHRMGYAHSVEAWLDERLAGGLYGVSLGGCFYGESMFSTVSDASKVAFVALAGVLWDADFGLIDCQQHTRHMESLGAVDVPRKDFLLALKEELKKPTRRGDWSGLFPHFPQSSLWGGIANRNSV